MASIIRIKRSEVAGNPPVLAAGELAYSALPDNGTNGGDRLYIGIGTEVGGDAANHFVIGGKFFTDRLSHTAGTLTANSAIVVDGNKKIDEFLVDNLKLDGNTLSSTNTNGDILISPAGTGKTIIDNLFIGETNTSINTYVANLVSTSVVAGTGITVTPVNNTAVVSITNTAVTPGSYGSSTEIPVITVNAQGQVTAASTSTISTTLSIVGNTGTDSIALGTDTLTFTGTAPIITAVSGKTVTISAADASTEAKGVARFNSSSFNVAAGIVSIKPNGVSNTMLANSSITIGTTSVSLGGTASTLSGLQQLTVDNIRLDNNVISAINGAEADVDLVLEPKGDGVVDVSGARITTVGDPIGEADAANKLYVDTVAQGLKARQAAWVLVDTALDATYDPDGHEVGWATLEANNNGAFPETDDVLSTDLNVLGARILVIAQSNAAHNGLYVVKQVGNGSTPWILRRCGSCYKSEQIPGSFVFIKEGTVYANTGWVASVQNVSTFTIGVDPITWIQFSGAGTYLAGNGLTLTGNTFSVNVPSDGVGGLEIVNDNVQVKSTLAGNGLSYNQGVITVGGTANRITVDSTSVDIASTYAGQTSIVTLGTITTGTWNGTIISPTYGGTGVNNGSSTITIGGNVTFLGSHTFNGTLTGNTSVTFPITGTLATLDGTETLTNKTINNSNIGVSNPGTAAFTTLTASGLVTFTNSTDATSLSSASVVLDGGLAVNKNIYAGDDIIGAGPSTSSITGFTIDGGTY